MRPRSLLNFAGLLTLAPAGWSQTVLYEGLDHDPLGAASLQLDPSTGNLVISNIGSSGQDGVRIPLHGFRGFDIEWDFQPGVSTNLRGEARARGRIGGGPNQPLARLSFERTTGGVALACELPAAPGDFEALELELDGVVVARFQDFTGPLLGLQEELTIVEGPFDAHFRQWGPHLIGEFTYDATLEPDEVTLPDEITFKVEGTSLSYDCDTIRVISPPLAGDLDELTEVQVLLNDSPDLMVHAESVRLLDQRFRGLADARLTAPPGGALHVSNIGASGLDGVALYLEGYQEGSEFMALDLANLPDPGTLNTGARLRARTRGEAGGLEDQELGELWITKTAGPLAVEADFSATGATGVRLQLFDDDSQIAEFVIDNGVLLRMPEWMTTIGKSRIWLPFGVACYFMAWETTVTVTVPTLGTFNVDEARFLAEGSTVPVTSLDQFRLLGRGLDDFEITGVTSIPLPPSPGDAFCSGDGTGAACPCANPGSPGAGCANSTGMGGRLSATGSSSVSADDLVLVGEQLPQQPGLFFQGTSAASGGAGLPFGDGLRCVVGSVRRLQIVAADPDGVAQTSVSIATVGNAAPGDVLYYQLWYRDPGGSPCGSGFNLTNGLRLLWGI